VLSQTVQIKETKIGKKLVTKRGPSGRCLPIHKGLLRTSRSTYLGRSAQAVDEKWRAKRIHGAHALVKCGKRGKAEGWAAQRREDINGRVGLSREKKRKRSGVARENDG